MNVDFGSITICCCGTTLLVDVQTRLPCCHVMSLLRVCKISFRNDSVVITISPTKVILIWQRQVLPLCISCSATKLFNSGARFGCSFSGGRATPKEDHQVSSYHMPYPRPKHNYFERPIFTPMARCQTVQRNNQSFHYLRTHLNTPQLQK